VWEEFGIEVKNIDYFGSQPWPFPNSLMVAFTAEWAGGEIQTEPLEIEDAGWYTVDRLPQLPPKLSIARAMIDHFVSQHGQGGPPE
jgi:NAD+ diphosphatase